MCVRKSHQHVCQTVSDSCRIWPEIECTDWLFLLQDCGLIAHTPLSLESELIHTRKELERLRSELEATQGECHCVWCLAGLAMNEVHFTKILEIALQDTRSLKFLFTHALEAGAGPSIMSELHAAGGSQVAEIEVLHEEIAHLSSAAAEAETLRRECEDSRRSNVSVLLRLECMHRRRHTRPHADSCLYLSVALFATWMNTLVW
jgi:hypothetical protein